MKGFLTWNDSGILVLFNVGLLSAVPQGVGVVLLHRIVELDLVMAKFSMLKKINSVLSFVPESLLPESQ